MTATVARPARKRLTLVDQAPISDVITQLDLGERRSVVFIIGGANRLGKREGEAIERQMASTIAPIVQRENAVVITGGTNAGVMKIVGSVFAGHSSGTPLVGVAPAVCVAAEGSAPTEAQASAEPHHHMVLVPGSEFGDESPYLIKLIEQISDGARILVVVAGGGDGTAREYEYCKSRSWPVIALAGTGGVADELALCCAGQSDQYDMRTRRIAKPHSDDPGTSSLDSTRLSPPNPRRRERMRRRAASRRNRFRIQSVKTLSRHPLASNASARVSHALPLLCAVPLESPSLGRMVSWPLSDANLLKVAWTQSAFLNERASQAQLPFRHIRLTILALGVAMTALAVLWVAPRIGHPDESSQYPAMSLAALAGLTSGLLVWVTRRQKDEKWISLRASSEAMRREIFRFRATAGDFESSYSAEKLFAQKLTVIGTEQARAVPGFTGPATPDLWPPQTIWEIAGDEDTLLSTLTKPQYIKYRINDQINYFASATSKDDRKVAIAITISVSLAFLTAVFAASGNDWMLSSIAILSSGIAAIASWLSLDRTEDRVQRMSTTSAGLRSILLDWEAQDDSGRSSEDRMRVAVERVEQTLEQENAEWRRGLLQAQELLSTVAAGGTQ